MVNKSTGAFKKEISKTNNLIFKKYYYTKGLLLNLIYYKIQWKSESKVKVMGRREG